MRPPRRVLAALFATAVLPSLPSAQTAETLAGGLVIEHTGGPLTCDRPTHSHDRVSVHYKGTLQSDGSQFDSSYNRNAPFTFVLDAGRVIKGWDKGLLGMCVGQSRRLIIPPELAYGDAGTGPIPGGATLVFETKLLDIVGLAHEPAPTTSAIITTSTISTITHSSSSSSSTTAAGLTITSAPSVAQEMAGQEIAGIEGLPGTPSDVSPIDDPPEQGRCHLLGPFALTVQGALGAVALLTLVLKRYREVPRRPWNIFFFDVSKQVFGSMLTHIINLAMSMLGSIDTANAAAHAANVAEISPGGKSPNPCSFYLLNLAIDTTIGVPVLWLLLKLLYHSFLRTPLANPPESIKSGHYGSPPNARWYLKQLLIYCIGLIGMKLFVFFLFLAMPFLPWIGDWALRWTEGNEALQIAFALFIFPLAMNAVQYYVIDNFIMDKKKGETQGYTRVDDHDHEDEERRAILDEEDITDESVHSKGGSEEGSNAQPLEEVEPLPISVSETLGHGEGNRRGSPRDGDGR